MKKLLTLIFAILAVSCTKAPVTLPALFQDHAVLQRGRAVPLWGSTTPGARVSAKWQGKTVTAKAGEDGAFRLELPEAPAGGPYTLTVNDVTLRDILVGDVFLASGQSNMELPVRRCMDAVGDDVKGYTNTAIRYFNVPMAYNFEGPRKSIGETSWQVLDDDGKALSWSAVCYFTAKSLQEETGVPVGMINASVGGSPIEAWLREELLPDYALKELKELQKPEVLDSINRFNASLYSDWQNAHNALPSPKNASWKPVDMFSKAWAVDKKGQNIYGSHLLRKRFRLDKAPEGASLLRLGALVDADSTFVNGQYVGNITYQYPPRNYNVPEGILKAGENEVEIHLYAAGGHPAHFVPDKPYRLETPDGNVSLLGRWEYKPGKRMSARPSQVFLQYKPAGLYNAMIAPLENYALSGVIWYQGESNCTNAAQYGTLLDTLIGACREEFTKPDLPFYIIELAAFEHSELTDNDWGWNRVQKEQRRTAERVPGAYLVPNADIGEWNDIHPQDKKTVGQRTARTILDN